MENISPLSLLLFPPKVCRKSHCHPLNPKTTKYHSKLSPVKKNYKFYFFPKIFGKKNLKMILSITSR